MLHVPMKWSHNSVLAIERTLTHPLRRHSIGKCSISKLIYTMTNQKDGETVRHSIIIFGIIIVCGVANEFRQRIVLWHNSWMSSMIYRIIWFRLAVNALRIIVDRHLTIRWVSFLVLTICLFLDIFDWCALILVLAGTHKSNGSVVPDDWLFNFQKDTGFVCVKLLLVLGIESSLVFIVNAMRVVETRRMCTIAVWNATNSGDV